jgi:hypothetical protein
MHVSTWIGVGRVWQQVGDEVVEGAADERGMLLPSAVGIWAAQYTLVKTRQARPEKLSGRGATVIRCPLPLVDFALKGVGVFFYCWSTVSCDLTFLPMGSLFFRPV